MTVKHLEYEQTVLAFTQAIKESQSDAIIFGASRGGWYIMKVLEHYGVPIQCFIDNDSEKQGEYMGYSVMSPQDVELSFRDSNVCLGILNQKNLVSIIEKLEEDGYKNIHYLSDAFLFVYFTEVVKRNVDKEIYAHSISLLYNEAEENYTTSPTLSYMITEKCSLNCQDCGAFVPETDNPETYTIDSIIDDIKKYCSAFDVVHHIALQGGEPFLHPQLEELCQRVAEIPNLIFIDFVTNGTVVPAARKLKKISDNGYTVLVSDYGSASTKIDKLTLALNKHNIYYDYYRYDENTEWGKQTPIFPRERSDETNTQFFQECISNQFLCVQIKDGEVHRCSFSNNAGHLGLIPTFENDFVRLNDDVTDSERSNKILKLASRDYALKACDHCPSMERKMVAAGIQVPRSK